MIYSAIASLDGYVADARGAFDWCAPDAEVHALINQSTRSVGTHLCGRRLYEVLLAWDGPVMLADPEPVMREFAQLVSTRRARTR